MKLDAQALVVSDVVGKRNGALIGFISVLAATGLALALMPDDPSQPGNLRAPAIALSIGLLFVPVLRLVFRSDRWLHPENFVSVGLIYWLLLDLIQGSYPLYGVANESIQGALISIGIFASMMWLGTLGRAWRLPAFVVKASDAHLDAWRVWKLILICFVLGMLLFVYSVDFDIVRMFSYIGEDRWSAPWQRGQLGGWNAFLDQMQYFGYLLPSLAVFLASKRGWMKIEVWLAFGLAFINLLFISQGGGRRIVGVTVGAAIICWLLTQPKLTFRTMVAATAAAAGLLASMQLLLEIRSQGYESFATFGRQYEHLHVDDNIYRLSQVIDIVPKDHPYVHLQQIVYVLVRPVPRVFWEEKPIDPGFDLSEAVGQEGTSLSISIIGEWYLVFGWLPVILGGWLHGRLAAAVGGLIEGSKRYTVNPIVYSVSVMVLVAGLRSMQDLVIMSYAVLAWYAVTMMLPKRQIFIGPTNLRER